MTALPLRTAKEGFLYGLMLLSHQRRLGAGSGIGGLASPEPPPLTPFLLPPALDVYSYDEDDMVLDPNLAEHLSHFGIDMLKMQKVRSPSDSNAPHPSLPGPSQPEAEAVCQRQLPQLSWSPGHLCFL